LVSLFFITWIFHRSWNVAFVDDAPSNADEAAFTRATVLELAERHIDSRETGRGGDPAPEMKTRDDPLSVVRARDGEDPAAQRRRIETRVTRENARGFGSREVRVRVHVVVESAQYKTTELLLVRNLKTKKWGPLESSARTSVPRRAGYKRLTGDPSVVDAAAAALFERLKLGQPPDVEFMQGIPAAGDGGDGDDGDDAVFVVLVRDENVLDDEDGVMLFGIPGGEKKGASAAGGAFGGHSGAFDTRNALKRTRGKNAANAETAEERNEREAIEMYATRRVPLRSALSGSASVDDEHALRQDLKPLRVFLEPWVLTDGKDPKRACRDPRVAAARAAGDEAEAESIYATLPIESRERPLSLQEKIHSG
jgi:hypothetical protein